MTAITLPHPRTACVTSHDGLSASRVSPLRRPGPPGARASSPPVSASPRKNREGWCRTDIVVTGRPCSWSRDTSLVACTRGGIALRSSTDSDPCISWFLAASLSTRRERRCPRQPRSRAGARGRLSRLVSRRRDERRTPGRIPGRPVRGGVRPPASMPERPSVSASPPLFVALVPSPALGNSSGQQARRPRLSARASGCIRLYWQCRAAHPARACPRIRPAIPSGRRCATDSLRREQPRAQPYRPAPTRAAVSI